MSDLLKMILSRKIFTAKGPLILHKYNNARLLPFIYKYSKYEMHCDVMNCMSAEKAVITCKWID